MSDCCDLSSSEIEQLAAIEEYGLTFAGDLISKCATKSLTEKGLVTRIEGWVAITREGAAVLTGLEGGK